MFPTIFIGHGSPMNVIEDNIYTQGWQRIAELIPKPEAIIAISAHWVTKGTKVIIEENPKIIYDFYGFPQELYNVNYPVKGTPHYAKKLQEMTGAIESDDGEWGIDHGTWSILKVMYPNADIPVCQLSIDYNKTPKELFQIGNKLKELRKENVLLFGSGNVVHNLRAVDFNMESGYDWANQFDNIIKDKIINKEYDSILNYQALGDIAKHSVPTTEHFNPLLYILGAVDDKDKVQVFNNSCEMGSLSMTSYVFG